MASRNSIKIYAENGFYHLYNRGVNKVEIFLDQQDFGTFLNYLKNYLSPKDEAGLKIILASRESPYSDKQKALKELTRKNFFGKIELLAYALMPNHFHLLVQQHLENGINHFMNALGTRYAGYFNRRYQRVGPIFQGVYKAVMVYTDEQFLHLSRYIHLNPTRKLGLSFSDLQQCPWPTSLPEYLEQKKTPWLKTNYILDYFRRTSRNNSYLSFLDGPIEEEIVSPISLDYESE